MAVNKKLLQGAAAAAGGLVPSEHFGVVLYEGDGSTSHSINGGKFGAAFYGNASNSSISVLPLGFNLQPYSVSCWFNTHDIASNRTIWGTQTLDANGTLQVTSAGKLRFLMYSTPHPNLRDIVSTTTLSTNTWYHAVALWDGSNIKLYLNGSLEGSDTATSMRSYNSNYFNIGAGNASQYFSGKIDQFRVFHKALSSSEISTLYAETASTVESLDPLSEDTTDTLQVLGDSSCIATYRFENNEDDLSGNYDGTGTAIQYGVGRYGQAADFNGSSSNVELPTGSPFNDSDTIKAISAWVKADTTSSRVYPFSIGSTTTDNQFFNFGYLGDSNNILVFMRNGSNSNQAYHSASTTTDTNWHHIVVQTTGSAVEIYLDGESQSVSSTYAGSGSASSWISYINYTGTVRANIGTNASYGPQYSNGKIDQVRFFNKALSASEVTTLYQENSLVASYRFEGNANDDTRNNDGTASNVTYEYGLNFTPDFVWVKNRDVTENHSIYDNSRTLGNPIYPNLTNAEANPANKHITSLDTGGFTLGTTNHNASGNDYVAWCLKANGGTTSSNTDGSITSTVQVNDAAGFSIIKFTGTGATATVGHGLSQTPEIYIMKNLEYSGYKWPTHTQDLGSLSGNRAGALNEISTFNVYTHASANSTTIGLVSGQPDRNPSGQDMIVYAFHSVDGFSKFGTYTGNGSTDGPIVETGFEPAFVMVKAIDAGAAWVIVDNKRGRVGNPRNEYLLANSSNSAGTNYDVLNFFSNGFQVVDSATTTNANGGSFLYMAFAADPDTEAPTVAKSFTTKTYTGTGSEQNIEGFGFEPSLLWIKNRATANHYLIDSVRGKGTSTYRFISPDLTEPENSTTTNHVTELLEDGFTVQAAHSRTNANGNNYVAWAWKADDNEATIEKVTEDADAVAIYELNQNANDSLGNYNGTITGTANWSSSGVFDYAANFTNWHINTGHSFNLANNSFSFSFWFANSATGTTNSYVISTDDPAVYPTSQNKVLIIGRKDSSGKLSFGFYANDLESATSVSTDGTWQHWVCTYNASTNARKIYLNGSLDASDTASADFQGTGNVELGYGIYQGLGKLDQVRIYDKELDPESVVKLYNETSSQTSTANIGTTDTISIKSIVSVNANAGFSIVKYEGTGVSGTKVPHGLSAAPDMVIAKGISGTATSWWVQHTGLSSGYVLELNSTAAEANWSSPFNNTAASSTVVTLGNGDTNRSGETQILYCFHSVSGFSDFGSYSGSGASGKTVTMGFQPDLVILKKTNGTSNWVMYDSVRGDNARVNANLSNAEATGVYFNFTSTGIEFTSATYNQLGDTYIYMAFKIN